MDSSFSSFLDKFALRFRAFTDIDDDIMQLIYQEYIATYYEKYTLFQLIGMLDAREIYISRLNKKAIIQMITDRCLDIPDKDRYDKQSRNEWNIYNMKYLDYTGGPYPRHIDTNVICISNAGTRTEIMVNDTFDINGSVFKIDEIKNKTLILKNIRFGNIEEQTIDAFMNIFDTNDVTIEHNHLRKVSWHMDQKYYTKIE